jgi:hypothetical protein
VVRVVLHLLGGLGARRRRRVPRMWDGTGQEAHDSLALQGGDRGHDRVRDLPLLSGRDVAEPPPLRLEPLSAAPSVASGRCRTRKNGVDQRSGRCGRERSRRPTRSSTLRVGRSVQGSHASCSSTRSAAAGGSSTKAHSTTKAWSGADLTGIGAPPGRLLGPAMPGGRPTGATIPILSRLAGRFQGSALNFGAVHRGNPLFIGRLQVGAAPLCTRDRMRSHRGDRRPGAPDGREPG